MLKVAFYSTIDGGLGSTCTKIIKVAELSKRGMGAAYKKGGRVKSMGIAKRGGGVAKR